MKHTKIAILAGIMLLFTVTFCSDVFATKVGERPDGDPPKGVALDYDNGPGQKLHGAIYMEFFNFDADMYADVKIVLRVRHGKTLETFHAETDPDVTGDEIDAMDPFLVQLAIIDMMSQKVIDGFEFDPSSTLRVKMLNEFGQTWTGSGPTLVYYDLADIVLSVK